MKKLLIIISMLCLLFAVFNVSGQSTKISLSDIAINTKGIAFKGNEVTVSLTVNKLSEKITLFKNDTIAVFAAYKIQPEQKKNDGVKNASFDLEVYYTCKYNGATKEEKAERIYFLNDQFQFTEKATINIVESKNSNPIKIEYKGTVIQ